jgi:hypothetical protein
MTESLGDQLREISNRRALSGLRGRLAKLADRADEMQAEIESVRSMKGPYTYSVGPDGTRWRREP